MVRNGWYFDREEVEYLLPRFTRVWGVLRNLFDLPDYPLGYERVNQPGKYYVAFDWNAVLGDDWRKASGEERKSNLQTISSVRGWGKTTGLGAYLSSPLPDGLPVTYFWSQDDTWIINGKRCNYYSPFTGYLDLKSYRKKDLEKIDSYTLAIREAWNDGKLPTPLTRYSRNGTRRGVGNRDTIWEYFTTDENWLSGNNYLLSSSYSFSSSSLNYYYNFSWRDDETGEYFVISKGRSEPKMGFYYYQDKESWIKGMNVGADLKYLLLCQDRPVFKTLNYP